MKTTTAVVALLGSLASLASAFVPTHGLHARNESGTPGTALVNYGILLFPAFDLVDIAGAVEALSFVSLMQQHTNLYLISAAGPGAVSSGLVNKAMNKFDSAFETSIVATHGLDEAKTLNLDVLLVPGGPGVRDLNGTQSLVDFIADIYPTLDHLVTICTGAGLAARAGVLDGRRATTNKNAWATITAMGPDVSWVAPARYVVDGNVWSSSGVTAGFDLMYKFVADMYGDALAEKVHNIIEYDPRPADFDPWTDRFNITHTE
jgi:transcriptional regulator GlxA family with amidase domain